jgi:hypothetical protein
MALIFVPAEPCHQRCGYARDALVGRMVTSDNLGFGPHR